MSLGFNICVGPTVSERDIVDVIVAMGGAAAPDEHTSAILSRGRRHIWIFIHPNDPDFMGVDAVSEIESVLDGPIGLEIEIRIGSYQGEKQVGLAIDLAKELSSHFSVAIIGLNNIFGIVELNKRALEGRSGERLID